MSAAASRSVISRLTVSWCARAALLAASGYLTAAAMASSSCRNVAWISLLPLLWAIRVLSPMRAAAAGALWGFSLYTAAVYALTTSVPSSAAVLAALVPLAAVYAALGAIATRLVGFHPLVLGVGWFGVELALAALGVRQGLLASTQGNGWLATVVGSALGSVFVGFVVVGINGVVVVVLHRLAQTDSGRVTPRRGAGVAAGWCNSPSQDERSPVPSPAQPRAPPAPGNGSCTPAKPGPSVARTLAACR